MSKSTTIHGVSLESVNGLKKITRTYSGVAFGAVEKKAFLLDPDPRFALAGDNTVRNRAQPRAWMQVEGNVQLGTRSNGAHIFDLAEQMTPGPVTKGSLNPSEWSIFTVVGSLVKNPITQRSYVTMTPVQDDSVIAPMCSLVAPNNPPGDSIIIIYEHSVRDAGQPRRLDYYTDLTNSGLNLVMYTFSVRHGLSIYLNGQRVAENKEDKRPLTAGYTAAELRLLFGSRGEFGITGGYSLDFNDPRNAGARRAIEQYCAWYYDITALKDIHPDRPSYFDLEL